MALDKAIINPEVDIELAELINEIVEMFRSKNIINEERGFCYAVSRTFYNFCKQLDIPKLRLMQGLFEIDNPEALPLNIMDLMQDEYEAFMDEYELDVDFTDDKEVSEYIWSFVQENLSDDEIENFYQFEHSWVEIDDIIVDFTWSQFKNAINTTDNLIDRYDTSHGRGYKL